MRGLLIVLSLMFALAYTSIKLAQERMRERTCFCDACVAQNYPDNGNGISYGTEGK